MNVILEMFFLSLSNTNIEFEVERSTWKKYTITKALPTTCQVKLINKIEIAKAMLDEHSKTFVIYMVMLEDTKIQLSVDRSDNCIVMRPDIHQNLF